MKISLEELISKARRHQSGLKKPRYPIEFKRDVVTALNDYPIHELVQKLGVGLSTMQKWRRTYGSSRKNAKRQVKSLSQKEVITFTPVIDPALNDNDTRKKPISSEQCQLEFSDNQGQSLSISIPWSSATAESLFKFIGHTLIGGGVV